MQASHPTEKGCRTRALTTEDPSRIFSRLLLVGTVHGDPHGFQRLNALLQFFKPDLILIELSPYGLSFRKWHKLTLQRTLARNLKEAAQKCDRPFNTLLRHQEIVAIRRQLSLPFEYRSAVRYANTTNARILLVDNSRLSRKWIASWKELISTENLLHLLSLPHYTRSNAQGMYAYAARLIGTAPPPPGDRLFARNPEGERLWRTRERYMARRIWEALEIFRPLRPIYLGGWWHLTVSGNPPTLRDILRVEPSRCLLLDRAGASRFVSS